MSGQRGFSLVELVIVLVLIGVLAAYASTRFDEADYERESHARELITALRYAQEKAMTNTGTAANYQVVTDANGFTVQLSDGTAVADPHSGAASYLRNWSNTTVSNSAPGNMVRFDGRGAPTSGATITITTGGASRTVTVEATTGYAH